MGRFNDGALNEPSAGRDFPDANDTRLQDTAYAQPPTGGYSRAGGDNDVPGGHDPNNPGTAAPTAVIGMAIANAELTAQIILSGVETWPTGSKIDVSVSVDGGAPELVSYASLSNDVGDTMAAGLALAISGVTGVTATQSFANIEVVTSGADEAQLTEITVTLA